ncbi:MAG: Eco57I restriction-modification methylase domain-containing protein [Armatimonadota bacterium]|nr:Eco57I restriction-modification methylase domain-containing protein [Armatimonadota bacterium]
MLLDLAGYDPCIDLGCRLAVEPAAGEGAFLLPMARRLVKSCRRYGRPLPEAAPALIAFELHGQSARRARASLIAALVGWAVSPAEAEGLARAWVRTGDYLACAPDLPPADFVLGNPPYLRPEDVEPSRYAAYRHAYRTMVGRADVYVGFFEAALGQLKPGGVCAFLCADRWMRNQYGAELRRMITTGYGVEAVLEMHEARPFEDDVSAYPAITVIRRGPQRAAVAARAAGEIAPAEAAALAGALRAVTSPHSVPLPAGTMAARVPNWFSGSDPWPCGSPAQLALLKRLEAAFGSLESEETGTRVGIGVATGRDDVFITTDPGLVETSRLLPLALARDTRHGTLRWSGHYLVDPWEEGGLAALPAFPRLSDYLRRHETALRARHVGRHSPERWYRTIDRVTPGLRARAKLYLPDIKDRIHPVLDRGETYPHHNLYYVVSDRWDLEVLGGLLLSDVGQLFVRSYTVVMRGGYPRFQAQYLRRIRVPRPDAIPFRLAEDLREAFRQRDVGAATRAACEAYGIPGDEAEALHGSGGTAWKLTA